MTLQSVLDYINQNARPSDRAAIIAAASSGAWTSRQSARRIKNAVTLAALSEGDSVTFPYGGCQYSGKIVNINQKTARVQMTKIVGTPRNRIQVGMKIRVDASILARQAA
jgi:hypothetical protein